MTPKEWVERIGNVMDIQKETGFPTMSMRFTRQELVELRMMCGACAEFPPKEDE